jgi:hypothetical protein
MVIFHAMHTLKLFKYKQGKIGIALLKMNCICYPAILGSINMQRIKPSNVVI